MNNCDVSFADVLSIWFPPNFSSRVGRKFVPSQNLIHNLIIRKVCQQARKDWRRVQLNFPRIKW